MRTRTRIRFLSTLGLLVFALGPWSTALADEINVVVWDERQKEQKTVYPNFLGNQIAEYLKTKPGLTVRSVAMDDPDQGLPEEVLENCDVLIWWGHQRHNELSEKKSQDIVRRIMAGRLSLIALHSAHFALPFMEAMELRAKQDALRKLPVAERKDTKTRFDADREWRCPKRGDRPTPSAAYKRLRNGSTEIVLKRPLCCFPAYRPDGMPSTVTTLMTGHPIAKGIDREFTIPHTEMYDEPFHVPLPDAVIFEERWEKGEHFRSGAVWNIGRGRVFYFRPGHETYAVYMEPTPLKILENTVRWMAEQKKMQLQQ